MGIPSTRSMSRLKRVGRYLVSKPMQIWRCDWQAPLHVIDVNADANWCGCKVGRKSTSGGTILRGGRLAKAWSKTQAVLAKSSAESELYAIVKGSCEGLGVCTFLQDVGKIQPQAREHIDASAAEGIVERRGLGKLRRIEADVLWLQELYARRRLVPLHKCLGTGNVADMLTKHIPANTIQHCSIALATEHPEGRSSIAQKLHSVESANKHRTNSNAEIDPITDKQKSLDDAAARYSEKDVLTRNTVREGKKQHRASNKELHRIVSPHCLRLLNLNVIREKNHRLRIR